MKLSYLVLLLAGNTLTTLGKIEEKECQILTQGFCLPKDYNKNQRPKMNESLNVQVKFLIEQVTAVDDQEFTVSLLMYLSLYWEDPSVVYIRDKSDTMPSDIPLNLEWANKLWLPDVFVYKMESVKQPEILQKFGSMR